jgi:hypothetical protein
MPSPVRKTASRYALAAENDQLRNLLKPAGVELDKDYAGMSLMERENTNMRKQLYAKKNKRKRTYTTGKARLMTSEEMTQALLDELHKKQMSELHSDLRKNVFPGIKKAIGDAEKAEKERAKKAVQAAKTAAKRVEQAQRQPQKQQRRRGKRWRERLRGLQRPQEGRVGGDADGPVPLEDGLELSEVGEVGGEGRTAARKKSRTRSLILQTKKLILTIPLSAQTLAPPQQILNLQTKKPISTTQLSA